MGSETSLDGEVRINVRAACAYNIKKVFLMRDGEVLSGQDCSGKLIETTLCDIPDGGYHWYVVNVEADSFLEGCPSLAQSSPYFVT